MKLSRNSWHAKVYLWWYRERCAVPNDPLFPKSVNLCPYVRTVLLYAPLRWAFLTGRKAWLSWLTLATLLQLAAYLEWGSKAFSLLLELLVIAALLAILAGAAALARRSAGKSRVIRSFGEVLAARYDAAHKHVCPVLELTDEQ